MDYSSLRNKAITYKEPGTTATEIVELPVAEPGPGEILIRMYLLFSSRKHLSSSVY